MQKVKGKVARYGLGGVGLILFFPAVIQGAYMLRSANHAPGLPRGGLGLIFPDKNSYQNPAAFVVQGTTIQGYGSMTNVSQGPLVITPSLVGGYGSWGVGLFGTQSVVGTASGSTTTDSVRLGVGLNPFSNASVGVLYNWQMPSTSGSGSGSSWQGSLLWRKRDLGGLAFGGSIQAPETNPQAWQGTLGVGMGFFAGNALELNYRFIALTPALNQASLFFSLQGPIVYFSAGDSVTLATGSHYAQFRLGFIAWDTFDFSAYVSNTLLPGTLVDYGASLRAKIL